MDGFLLAFLTVIALASGGRDQAMVAQWSDVLGKGTALLSVAVLSATMTASAMAWIGADFAALLPVRARQMLVAFALGAAAVELAWPVKTIPPREPTRSLFAVLVVLAARQIGDGARFGILAFAAWSGSPIPAALGGALGGAAVVTAGWSLGAAGLASWPLRPVRLVLAGALLIAALFIGLDARFASG